MPLTAPAVAEYLRIYSAAYRREFLRLTAAPPKGAGYPLLAISPYMHAGSIECLVSPDGVAVFSSLPEPEYKWWIAGGPAIMVDYAQTKTPEWIVALLKAQGIYGKPIGIYRIVSKAELPAGVWHGRIEPIVAEAESTTEDTKFVVRQTNLPRLDVIERLTFGAVGRILNFRIPGPESPFWVPHIIRSMGFLNADRTNRRFFNYLELVHHADDAAWDPRAIPTRVQADVRRDFGWAFGAASGEGGGTISFGEAQAWTQPFYDRLAILGTTLLDFANLLETQSGADERVFHDFIQANPILLDVYAEPISKPRWYYPTGSSPLGKEYVEPDFVLKYPDGGYRLVELERPSKSLATAQGQPRAEVNQAAFQIAEWRAYIANHYDLLKEKYPGISIRQSATIVISRSTAASYGDSRDPRRYKELLASQYSGVDILTYDELLERAKQAYTRITSLGVG
jgi:hypothetical protein